MTKSYKIMNYALVSVTFVLFLIFVIFAESPDERDWKPLAYGAAVIFFFLLVREGLKISISSPQNWTFYYLFFRSCYR